MAQVIILVAMFALAWALLIRPQRNKQQQQQKLLSAVEPGDEVLTVGGLYGIVSEIDEEDDLIVEVAEGIRVRIARRAVAGVVKPEDDEDEDDEASDEGEETAEDDVPTAEAKADAPGADASGTTVEEADAASDAPIDEDAVVNGEGSVSARPSA